MNSPVVTVTLDRERKIAFTNAARFRLGAAAVPFNFEDLRNPRRAFAALCTWVWACLVPEDAKDFATPEAVAEHVPPERQAEVLGSLLKALEAASESRKNGDGSTPKPSPASS